MDTTVWTQPAVGAAALALVFAGAWLRQRQTRNAGLVDVVWTVSVGGLGVAWCLLGAGWAPRRVLVASLIGLWCVRLAAHLAHRVLTEEEDGRYRRLRQSLGDGFDRWMVGFFAAQALSAVLLSLPMLMLAQAPEQGWRPVDAAAVSLWVVSWAGEALADRQLAAFRARPENRGRTCRSGLWAWSRHPNYFFEWLHWCVYPLLAVGLQGGGTLWLAPLAMLYLVLKVTGIPPTEEQSLLSRGDDYRAYQRTTSAFFPLPPRGARPLPTPK
jgi:steroid 5-alpha reductase family enzyme